MIELIITLIILVVILVILVYGSIFFVTALAYAYWGLSIGMAPVVWIILLTGMAVGFVCAVKNAVKAVRKLHGKRGES